MNGKDEPTGGAPKRLGRGIGALLTVPVRIPGGVSNAPGSSPNPGTQPVHPVNPVVDLTTGSQFKAAVSAEGASGVGVPRGTNRDSALISVPVHEVSPNPRQPRKDFDEASIRALAESIRSAGLMQPIVVRRSPTGAGSMFELIAGERRWRAAKLLQLPEIPAVLREVGDQTAAEWALIENVQREDLNPIERSEAILRLIKDFELTHQELGDRLGLDRATISNLIRLDELDAFTKDAVRRGALSQGHAKVLLGVANSDLRRRLASAVIGEGISVRELERRIRQGSVPAGPASPSTKDSPSTKPHIADLEKRLSEHLGTKVVLKEDPKKKGSGQIIIDYYSIGQFEGLMTRFDFRTGF